MRTVFPAMRMLTLRFQSGIGNGVFEHVFPVDTVVFGVSSFVSFSNLVAATSAVVVGGFDVSPVSITPGVNQSLMGVVHFYHHGTPFGLASPMPDTVDSQDTAFDGMLVRAGRRFNVETALNGLKNFEGAFVIRHRVLSEWLAFSPPSK